MKDARIAEAYGMGDVKIGQMTGQYPNPSWLDVDYSQIELRTFAMMTADGMTPSRFRDLYMQQPKPASFIETAWNKLRARPATFSWGDPIPGLWQVPGYPELTTAQLEQVMRDKGIW